MNISYRVVVSISNIYHVLILARHAWIRTRCVHDTSWLWLGHTTDTLRIGYVEMIIFCIINKHVLIHYIENAHEEKKILNTFKIVMNQYTLKVFFSSFLFFLKK